VFTPAQTESGARLIRHIIDEIKRIYDFTFTAARSNIIGHYQIVPRWKPICPGANFPFTEIIGKLDEPAAVKVPDAPDVSPWAQDAHKWVTETGISDGMRPRDTVTREEMWTMLHRHNNHFND
jgi:hypothetical protein